MEPSANPSDQDREHREVWERLPWYVNRTLDAHEHGLVEQHLRNCLVCRAEVNTLRRLEREVRDRNPLDDLLEQSLATTKARIATQRSGQSGARRDNRPAAAHRHRWLSVLTNGLRASPASVRGMLAFQTMLVVAIGLFIALPRGAGTGADYQLLSAQSSPVAARGQRWQIVFSEQITERRLRGLLRTASARIVDGPSRTGVYTVVLDQAEGNDASAGERVAMLRSVPDVRFLLPMAGNGEPR